MNFSYFKENKLNLKRPVILAISLLSVLSLWSQDYNNIEFIENKGQWDSRVKFKGDVNAGAFFLRSGGFTVLQHNQQDLIALEEAWHGQQHGVVAKTGNMVLRSHAWNVDFLGADPVMEIAPDKGISTYNNYFLGNDPSKWASGCRIFQAVTLRNVYPNIDVRYYTSNGVLKYDIIVRPGGNVSRIALQYEGVDKLQVKNKELIVGTSIGERKESAPYTYQSTAKGRAEIDCRYKISGNIVRFDIKDYDPSSTLIIDPTMVFCSFTGSTTDNWGYTATYGPDGSMFGGGIVRNANGFPASPGAFQTTYQGGSSGTQEGPCDIGIIKLSPTGNARVYATYIGGTANEQPHSLIVDNQGNLIMAGRSNSANYPTTSAGQIGTGGAFDIVVTKFNPTGTALLGSKKIGGTANDGVNITPGRGGVNSLQQNYGDDGRSEVIIDGGGNIYVASCTQSATDFPVTAGTFQGTYGGGTQDGVLMKFSSALAPLFISYLGGSSNDAAYVLSLGANGNIFVAGCTESANFT